MRPISIVCLTTGSEQHAFVLSDLAAVDRTKTPWLVVGGHRPMYISSTNTLPLDGDQTVAQELRDAFEEAFVQYKVGRARQHDPVPRRCAAVCSCLCLGMWVS